MVIQRIGLNCQAPLQRSGATLQKEERLMLEGWEAFVSTSLALFQAEVWEQMDDINTLH